LTRTKGVRTRTLGSMVALEFSVTSRTGLAAVMRDRWGGGVTAESADGPTTASWRGFRPEKMQRVYGLSNTAGSRRGPRREGRCQLFSTVPRGPSSLPANDLDHC
jgi:hypothetical protein